MKLFNDPRDNSSKDADLSTTSDPPPLVGLIPPIVATSQTSVDFPNRQTQLNNFLMDNGKTAHLQYTYSTTGPPHKPTWHCIAYSKSGIPLCGVCLELSLVDNIPYAIGHGKAKHKACENAAANCYAVLRPQ